MAKKAVQNTVQGNRNSIAIQQTHVEDDSLLPSAEEISKYHEIDPTIVDWLKTRAEKEQEHRHQISNEKANIVSKNEQSTRLLNLVGLIFGFIITMACMSFSYYLIKDGHEIKGSIFLGSTVIIALGIFVTRVYNKKD